MEALRDAGALASRVGAVRRAAPGYSTNLYAWGDQIGGWCAAGRFAALSADRAVLLLRATRDFHHVFHVAEDQAALRDALAALPPDTYVADLIGRGDALDEVCATYAAAGFVLHTILRRMARVQPPGEVEEGEAEVAAAEDVADVVAFLERLLDPLAEQVPDAVELEREARAGQLLVARREGVVTGMLLYALEGRAAELRFWHVDPDSHGQGIGRVLMQAFLARCAAARRLVLWVIGDNDRSIAIYRHYGFEIDGLVDHIMIRRKEPQR